MDNYFSTADTIIEGSEDFAPWLYSTGMPDQATVYQTRNGVVYPLVSRNIEHLKTGYGSVVGNTPDFLLDYMDEVKNVFSETYSAMQGVAQETIDLSWLCVKTYIRKAGNFYVLGIVYEEPDIFTALDPSQSQYYSYNKLTQCSLAPYLNASAIGAVINDASIMPIMDQRGCQSSYKYDDGVPSQNGHSILSGAFAKMHVHWCVFDETGIKNKNFQTPIAFASLRIFTAGLSTTQVFYSQNGICFVANNASVHAIFSSANGSWSTVINQNNWGLWHGTGYVNAPQSGKPPMDVSAGPEFISNMVPIIGVSYELFSGEILYDSPIAISDDETPIISLNSIFGLTGKIGIFAFTQLQRIDAPTNAGLSQIMDGAIFSSNFIRRNKVVIPPTRSDIFLKNLYNISQTDTLFPYATLLAAFAGRSWADNLAKYSGINPSFIGAPPWTNFFIDLGVVPSVSENGLCEYFFDFLETGTVIYPDQFNGGITGTLPPTSGAVETPYTYYEQKTCPAFVYQPIIGDLLTEWAIETVSVSSQPVTFDDEPNMTFFEVDDAIGGFRFLNGVDTASFLKIVWETGIMDLQYFPANYPGYLIEGAQQYSFAAKQVIIYNGVKLSFNNGKLLDNSYQYYLDEKTLPNTLYDVFPYIIYMNDPAAPLQPYFAYPPPRFNFYMALTPSDSNDEVTPIYLMNISPWKSRQNYIVEDFSGISIFDALTPYKTIVVKTVNGKNIYFNTSPNFYKYAALAQKMTLVSSTPGAYTVVGKFAPTALKGKN